MIKIVLEDGRSRPKFYCDFCEEAIEKASAGLYLWKHARTQKRGFVEGVPADVFTGHKGVCDRGFCERMRWKRNDPMTMELRVLPIYLGTNMGLDWRAARQWAEDMGSF